MKKIPFLAFMILSLNLFGQINKDSLAGKISGVRISEKAIYSENDNIPIVVNLKEAKKGTNVLYYLNEKVVDEHVINAINPNKIKGIKVEKESIEYDKVNYSGIIYIQTKENYKPRLITLNALKSKYLDLADKTSTLFMLDEKIINMDYDEFKVDENYILKIEVQSVENSKEKLNINVIRLITRTKENVEKANTIRLKGNELHGMNKTSH